MLLVVGRLLRLIRRNILTLKVRCLQCIQLNRKMNFVKHYLLRTDGISKRQKKVLLQPPTISRLWQKKVMSLGIWRVMNSFCLTRIMTLYILLYRDRPYSIWLTDSTKFCPTRYIRSVDTIWLALLSSKGM